MVHGPGRTGYRTSRSFGDSTRWRGYGTGSGKSVGGDVWVSPGVVGHFGSLKARDGAGARFGLQLFGTKGAIFVGTGGLPTAYLIEDPSWGFKGQSKWQPITSAGLGGKETQTDTSLNAGNKFIVNDLLDSIEKGREPVGSLKDGGGPWK